MEKIAEAFGEGKSLYEIMGVTQTATAAEIKKAYFKLALTCHPDKCPGDEAAHSKFLALSMIHSVLSDEEKRATYDETGELQEKDAEFNQANFDMWYDYYRNLFPKLSTNDIDNFKTKYQGSEEEKADVIAAYKSGKGKMENILATVMLAEDDDESRFREIIDAAIAEGELDSCKAYEKGAAAAGKRKKSAASKKKAEKEAEEASSLADLIRARNEQRNSGGQLSLQNTMQSLEQKYGGGKKGKKGAQASAEPTEEEFAAARARIEEPKKKGRKK